MHKYLASHMPPPTPLDNAEGHCRAKVPYKKNKFMICDYLNFAIGGHGGDRGSQMRLQLLGVL